MSLQIYRSEWISPSNRGRLSQIDLEHVYSRPISLYWFHRLERLQCIPLYSVFIYFIHIIIVNVFCYCPLKSYIYVQWILDGVQIRTKRKQLCFISRTTRISYSWKRRGMKRNYRTLPISLHCCDIRYIVQLETIHTEQLQSGQYHPIPRT